MAPETQWLALILGGVALAYAAATFVPPIGDAIAVRFARRAGLEPDGEGEVLRRRVLRRSRAAALGAALGAGAVVAIILGVRAVGLFMLGIFLDGGAVLTGVLLGAALGGFAGSRAGRPRDTGVRVAPVRTLGLGDYLAPREALTARLLPAAAVVLAFVVVIETGAQAFHIPGFPPMWSFFIPAALAVLAAVAFEIVARVIVAGRALAATDSSLALDAALRAADLRALCLAPVLLGLFGVHIGIMRIIDSFARSVPQWTTTILTSAELLAFGLALVLLLVYALSVAPRRARIPRVAVATA